MPSPLLILLMARARLALGPLLAPTRRGQPDTAQVDTEGTESIAKSRSGRVE
jgi:hypothetical protein